MAKSLAFSNKRYYLILGDIAILFFSLYLTLLLRYGSEFNSSLWSQHLLPFSIVIFFWLAIFYISDLYELGYRQGAISIFLKILGGSAIAGVFAVLFFYFSADRLFSIKPQRVLFIDLIIAIAFLYGWRLSFNQYLRSAKIASGVLLIGFNALAAEIIDKILANPQLGLQLRGIIALSDNVPENYRNFIIADSLEQLPQICLNRKTSLIISTVHPRENPTLLNSLFGCIPLRINFFDIATFYEKITGKVPVTTIEQIWFLENLTAGQEKIYEHCKHIYDYSLAFILIILSLLFWPLIALAIKFSSHGPVFFIQKRVGKDGKIFEIIKFRTMVAGAEKNGPQWAVPDDKRVTPLGRFFRKTRIDEIPQLINILRGEMSLIGPRPERPEFVEKLQAEIPFYRERLLVKPGLTGWAQVVGPAYGGTKEESLEKLQYDLYYIKNQSFGLDISIMLKTVKTMITRKGQ